MALSKVQVGVIGQMEFIKLGTMGSQGRLDFASPFADDDGRDHEIHRRGHFGRQLSIQTKTITTLIKPYRAYRLQIGFFIPIWRLASSPLLWYFLAHLDRRTMSFSDPCFLIPSRVVYRHAASYRRGRFMAFTVTASMSARSRDKWTPYRVSPASVGQRLLAILTDLDQRPRSAFDLAAIQDLPATIHVRLGG